MGQIWNIAFLMELLSVDSSPHNLKDKYSHLSQEAVESVEFFRDRYGSIWGEDERKKFDALVSTMEVQAELISLLSAKAEEAE